MFTYNYFRLNFSVSSFKQIKEAPWGVAARTGMSEQIKESYRGKHKCRHCCVYFPGLGILTLFFGANHSFCVRERAMRANRTFCVRERAMRANRSLKKSDGAKSDGSDLLLGIKRGKEVKSRHTQTKNSTFFEQITRFMEAI